MHRNKVKQLVSYRKYLCPVIGKIRHLGISGGDYLIYDSGLRLGWLINPQQQQVAIYRPNQNVEIVQFPIKLLGEDVLPGFVLDLAD